MSSPAAPTPRQRALPTRPRGAPRQQRAEVTRQRILDETVSCILEEGYAAASARAITRRAGVTWGVVQYHFGDRDGILAEVVESGMAELEQAIAGIALEAGSTRTRVEQLVEAGWRAYTSPLPRAGLEILVATRTRRADPLAERMEPMGRAVLRLTRDVFPEDDGTAGRVLFLGLRGMALDQLLSADVVDSRRERSALVHAVLHVLGEVSP